MIGRWLARGVEFAMGATGIRARDPRSLRAALAAHLWVPPSRLAELGNLSDRALNAQGEALDALSVQLARDLAPGGPSPASALAAVQAQDTPLPGHWGDAVSAARRWSDGQAALQRVVLERLVEYLGSERACVRVLVDNRERAGAATGDGDGIPRQQLVIDPAALAGSDGSALAFERLAKGDPLKVPMSAGQALEIMLAQHRFLLVSGVPWLLVDDLGEDLRLRPGRSVVGRSTDCEAMVHESYRAISRRHAVLEIHGTGSVTITDVSSLGTFVPAADCTPPG